MFVYYIVKKTNVRKERNEMRKFVFIIVTMCMVLCFGSVSFGKTESKKTEVYYEVVDVAKGDTLWTIAERFNTGYDDVRDYIEEIKEFNNMKGYQLTSGSRIVVPIYL